MSTHYLNQKILVFGMGLSGQSMVAFLKKKGAFVVAYDDRKEIKSLSCPLYSSIEDVPFKELDLIAFSPGIHPSHPLFIRAKEKKIPCIGEIELGAREITTPCIGVTGTNGKSTVVSLLAHVFNHAHIPAIALGNIGEPLTSRIEELKSSLCILELSSYQIEALTTRCLDHALLLNITPDHLSRYQTFDNYVAAKFLIQRVLKPNGQFLVEASLHKQWKDFFFSDKKAVYNHALIKTLKKRKADSRERAFFAQMGPLERLNYAAVFSVCQSYSLEEKKIWEAFFSFKGLPHRCEFVRKIHEISFYNDSKATNIESVKKAVTSFKTPLRLIMGGEDKGLDFSSLVPYFKNKVKKIYVIGEAQGRMQKEFGSDFDVECCSSLEEAIHLAYRQSQLKDTVLLSPACSSFDMFRNFEHRGDLFKQIVNQFQGEDS